MDANRWLSVSIRCSVSFNPRARDGREINHAGIFLGDGVSIHAPVMDAKIANTFYFL